MLLSLFELPLLAQLVLLLPLFELPLLALLELLLPPLLERFLLALLESLLSLLLPELPLLLSLLLSLLLALFALLLALLLALLSGIVELRQEQGSVLLELPRGVLRPGAEHRCGCRGRGRRRPQDEQRNGGARQEDTVCAFRDHGSALTAICRTAPAGGNFTRGTAAARAPGSEPQVVTSASPLLYAP